MKPLSALMRFLGSYGLACVLLFDLFLLTLFGTLYQVEAGLYEAQRRYFESWFVVQSRPVPLVLPGGLFCMGLLAVNLFVGGFVRIKKSGRTVGVLVVHTGIALLLASAFVKLYHSSDGHLTLVEGESSDEFQSYVLWEVAIWDASQTGPVEEHLIPHAALVDLVGGRTRTFTSPALPFEVELSGFLRNCRPLPKGPNWQAESPAVDGYALEEIEPDTEAERNLAGLTVRLRDRASARTQDDILWGLEEHPWANNHPVTFDSGGETWALSLRHVRYAMPFTVRLEDVRREDHPGTITPRSYESDIVKVDGGNEQKVLIQMNDPLRDGGLVLFQSGFNQLSNGREISTFSVVRNPSDYWPLYACIVIGLGLLIAFVPKLIQFASSQERLRARGVSA